MCKGTITQKICLMHESNRIESQPETYPEDQPVPGLQDADPLGNNMLREESIGLDHRGRRLGMCNKCGGF